MGFCKYTFNGATHFEMTDFSAGELAQKLPGASNIVVQAAPFEDAPISFPDEVKTVQLLRALRAVGKSAAFKNFVGALTGDLADDWDETTSVRRGDVIVSAMRDALDLSDRDVDKLFSAAASL